MTSPRTPSDQDPLDSSDPETNAFVRELSGEPDAGDTRAFFDIGDVADIDEGLSESERERGYSEAGVDPSGGGRLEDELSVDTLVERELRSDETFDPYIAAEEAIPYVPPTDPVVRPVDDDPQGLAIASGVGTSSLDEPYDADHHSSFLPVEDEMTARVREALRADASTSGFADQLFIDTADGIVLVRGTVSDIEDSDAVLAVASVVEGVTEVRDELEVEGL